MDILIWRVVPYKYQSDIEKNQLENNFFLSLFFLYKLYVYAYHKQNKNS